MDPSSAPPKAQTPVTGSGQVSISVLRRSHHLLAPDAVFFRASVRDDSITEARAPTQYDPSFHKLRYEWSFGDPGAVSDKVRNLPLAHNDLDTAYGKEVAHVFHRPGNHEVTCTVHGPEGLIGRDTFTVRVDDPGRVFAGAQTVLLDPTGRGDPLLYPGARVVQSWEAAFAAPSPGTITRILLRRNTRFTRQSTQVLNRRVGSLHIGAFGEGDPPVVQMLDDHLAFDVVGNFDGDVVFQGIDFRGPWDSTRETGTATNGRRIGGLRSAHGNSRMVLVDDCRFDGFSITIWLSNDPDNPDPGLFVIQNCAITNWGDYGLFAGPNMGAHIAVLGSRIAQTPEALQGGGPKNGTRNDHGPVRITGTGHFHMDGCDLFSRNGWTRLEGVPADQPCLRWNTRAMPGSIGMVTRTAMEGGYAITALRDADNRGTRFLSNLVMEKCLLVGTATTVAGILVQFTGQTVRNNIVVMPDVPSAAINWQSMIRGHNGQNPEGQMDPTAPVEIYSNTFLQLRSPAHQDTPMEEDWGMMDFAVFTYENNLFATPNMGAMSSGEPGLELGGGFLETVDGLWTPRFEGLRYQPQQWEMDRRFATPSDPLRDLIARTGTPGADDAMGTAALDDFFGQLRRDTPDRGAIES